MKKIIAIFLLFFFCLGQTGHFIAFYIQKLHLQRIVRNEILAGVPDKYLEIIEENTELEWEEEGKEFSFHDELYDVVRSKIINGKRFFFCLNDKNEEQLIKNFTKTIKTSNDNERGKSNKHSFKSSLMDEHLFYALSLHIGEQAVMHSYFIYKASLISTSREIIIPPPRHWS